MPSKTKFTSPFATAFKSGCKSGTPCGAVVSNISKKTGKSVATIIKSLSKAGLCWSQKFNGAWICWPTFTCKAPASKSNPCQTQMWQCFIDWCCMTGACKPTQLWNKTGSQKAFMSACKSLFGKQWSSSTTGKKKSRKARKTARKSRTTLAAGKTRYTKHTKKRTVRTPSYWNRSNYKFASYRRRLSRAA